MNTIDSSNDGDYDYDYQIVPPPPSRVINMEDSLDVRDVEPKPPSAAAAGSQLRVVKLLKFIGALVCLGIGIVSWILMAEALQGMFQKYPKPYFLAFYIRCFYSLLYVGWKIWREFPGNCACNESGDGALPWKRALWSSCITAVFAVISAYFWYLSLTRTSVPANTAVYQSCVAFVFILSVPILRERVTVIKIVAVVFAIGGVVIISYFSEGDKSQVKNTPLGFVFLMLSVVTYALLEVLFKKFASPKNDPAVVCNSLRYTGLLGVHSLMWAWVPLIPLHFSGIEPFEFPTLPVMKLIFLNALMDVIYNGAVFLCIALSSPLFTSVGVITAIPLSIVVEFIVHKKTSSYPVYLGMVLIVFGFIGFCVSEYIATRQVVSKGSKSIQQKEESSTTVVDVTTVLLYKKKSPSTTVKSSSSLFDQLTKYYII